jgi:hypothetical protein
MSVQVFSRFNTPAGCDPDPAPCTGGFTGDIIKGLERVYELRDTHTFAAVNMSLGGGQFSSACDGSPEKPIIDNLRSANIATVVSSGNAGFTNAIEAPGCISTAIAVGATTKADQVPSFSNGHATLVDLLAPGVAINSAVPGGGFASFSGTSMATPHVAGAWALLREHSPDASVADILADLQATGLMVTDTRPGAGYAHPRIRIFDAAELDPSPLTSLDEGFGMVPPVRWHVTNLSQPLGTSSWFQGVPAVIPAPPRPTST